MSVQAGWGLQEIRNGPDQFYPLMYLQVAVISIETQSLWTAWNSMGSSQRSSSTDWGSNGSDNPVHLPLIPRCGGFSKYSSKSHCFENKWNQNWQIGRRPHLDTEWDKGKEERFSGLDVAAVECRNTITNFYKWPACIQEGVKSANHVCYHRMGTTGQLRESNRQWSLLIYKSSHVLIYGAPPHPFQKRLISKMMKL